MQQRLKINERRKKRRNAGPSSVSDSQNRSSESADISSSREHPVQADTGFLPGPESKPKSAATSKRSTKKLTRMLDVTKFLMKTDTPRDNTPNSNRNNQAEGVSVTAEDPALSRNGENAVVPADPRRLLGMDAAATDAEQLARIQAFVLARVFCIHKLQSKYIMGQALNRWKMMLISYSQNAVIYSQVHEVEEIPTADTEEQERMRILCKG